METSRLRASRKWFLAVGSGVFVLEFAWWYIGGEFQLPPEDPRVSWGFICGTTALVGLARGRSLTQRLAVVFGAVAGTAAAFGALFVMFLSVGS